MAMVMYLFTCGFVCDNSNVHSTCNIHTDSKCITYNNAYASKHDIVINVHESHYSASASAFINHSLNPAKRLLSLMWRYTEEHSKASVHWHTVRGRSHCSQ